MLLICAVASILAYVACTIGASYCMRPLTNLLKESGITPNETYAKYLSLLAGLGTLYFLSAVTNYLLNRLMLETSTVIMRELRAELFARMQKLPISYFDANTNGSLMSYYTNDIEATNELLQHSITQMLISVTSLTGTIAMMLTGAFPMVTLIRRYLGKPLEKLGRLAGLEASGSVGLVACLPNGLAMFPFVKEMRPRDKVVCMAFLACGGYSLGDFLAFNVNFQPNLLVPVFVGQICGGIIGIGEPAGHQYQGRYLQLASELGVEKETGFTLNYDKYNWEEHRDHFILADAGKDVDFGEGKKSIYALDGAEVLIQRDKEVQLAVNECGRGRGVYISGLPYSFANSRLLYRAILWAAHGEDALYKWYSSNYNVEVHAFVKNGKYCVVNNTYAPQNTTVYTDSGSFDLHLEANEIRWYEI